MDENLVVLSFSQSLLLMIDSPIPISEDFWSL